MKVNFRRTLSNISERRFFGELLTLCEPMIHVASMEWGKKYRIITSDETSFGIGQFDPSITPYLEYVYECLDSPFIPTIVSRKSARIAWTETINTYRGCRMHTKPTNILLGFATKDAAKAFAVGKWKHFISNTLVLRTLVNKGIPLNKRSNFEYYFPRGMLKLVTLGAITNQKSDNWPYIEIEEPDDAKDEVSGQGDTLANLQQRQKTVPLTMRKLIFGGTPTNKGFSRVDKAVLASNQLVFKACCHECNELVPLDGRAFAFITYKYYPDMKIDQDYGKHDPSTAVFNCPFCKTEWSFEQKNLNILEGKKYGFTDHTGNFSKGWHPLRPEVTEVFGFIFSELLSPFPASTFVKLAELQIKADLAKAKGDERLAKSFSNNSKGESYAAGDSGMEVEEMVTFRKNYEENKMLYGYGAFTIGIDVQHNRFAVMRTAFGPNGNMQLLEWTEIWGNVFNKTDPCWKELTEYCLAPVTHLCGKPVYCSAVSIDSGDGGTTELVYDWVLAMQTTHIGNQARATKGTKALKPTSDPIFQYPAAHDITAVDATKRTLAETKGILVYNIGAHAAHDEILRRIALNRLKDLTTDVFIFCETAYGRFEEQILSCTKIVDDKANYNKVKYKLKPGENKEAIDCAKMALHASIGFGIRDWSNTQWSKILASLT